MDQMQTKSDAPKLPEVSDFVARTVLEWIQSHEHMQRPPEVTAKILAFMVLLDDEQIYFPTRPVVAEHLGVSIPSIDVVLSQRQAMEHIQIVTEVERGFVKQRPSTIKRRRVIPVPEIVKVVHDALAEEARLRGGRRRKPISASGLP